MRRRRARSLGRQVFGAPTRSSKRSLTRAPPRAGPASRRERIPRPRLDRAQRDAQRLRDLALGEASPVRELDHHALVLRQLLNGPMDAPREPRALGAVRRARLGGCLLVRLDRRLGPSAGRVDDRVPRDRVDPRAALAALPVVAAGRPPDRGERLLQGVLRAAGVAQSPHREAEHWSRIAPVELLERVAISLARALDQLRVRRLPRPARPWIVAAFISGRRRSGGCGSKPLPCFAFYATALPPVCSSRPPSTTTVVPVTNEAPAR